MIIAGMSSTDNTTISEPELSADGGIIGAAHAGDDHPLLPGLVSDADHRRAAIHGFDFFDLLVLSRLAKRAISPDMVQDLPVPAISHVTRDRPHDHQYTRGA